MSDRDIRSWEERLKRQTLRGWDNYVRRRIDLSVARAVEYLGIAGEFFYVEQVSSESARAGIRINRNTNDELDLEFGTIIKTVFTDFYITNTAQAGEWIDIIIGINFEYYKKSQGILGAEAQPAIVITNAIANTDTQGPANVCNRVLLRASPDNGGRVWVNFGAAAVVDQCLPLDAGDMTAVNLSNTDRIHALFTIADENLFVVFER